MMLKIGTLYCTRRDGDAQPLFISLQDFKKGLMERMTTFDGVHLLFLGIQSELYPESTARNYVFFYDNQILLSGAKECYFTEVKEELT